MSPRLALTSAEQRDVAAAFAALLDVGAEAGVSGARERESDERDPDPWPRAVADAMRPLFRADYTLFCEFAPDRVTHFSDDLPTEAVDAHRQLSVASRDRIQCADPVFDPLLAARPRFAWSSDLVEAWCGGRFRKTAMYDLLWAPFRTTAVVGLIDSGPGGGQKLDIVYRGRSARRVERQLAIVTLLAPAYHAAGVARRRQVAHRNSPSPLAWTDTLAEGVLVVGRDGRELHHNAALARTLAAEPDAAGLRAALHRMAAAALAVHAFVPGARVSGGRDATPATTHVLGAPPSQTIRTRAAVYAATAVLTPPGTAGADATALLTVRRLFPVSSPAADHGALRHAAERCGLTPREGAVAVLVAHGLTNGELADALGISPHTARHHTEHVLQKLGVRSRRAVARRLLHD